MGSVAITVLDSPAAGAGTEVAAGPEAAASWSLAETSIDSAPRVFANEEGEKIEKLS